ncbi:Spore development regulator ryp2 [Onygenales sp. PD_10]|nr:Spore development regulator ryp2 [Onygenales sp. PD_10]
MSGPVFEDPVTQTTFPTEDYVLTIRQNPERARVAGGKEKERKPVDPPPIIQLRIDESVDQPQNYLQNPFYFMYCTLYHATEDHEVSTSQAALAGTLVSSFHRLKDTDNTDGGFFVFGDLSVKMEGEFRLRFDLFELRKWKNNPGNGAPYDPNKRSYSEGVVFIKSIISKPFTVSPPKNFPGMAESTALSRSFADQGVKLRIRKEARTLMKRPLPREEYGTTMAAPRSPERSSVSNQSIPTAYQSSREYPYYGGPDAKRPRSSVDMSGRGMFDGDARYASRPVDAYQPHAANPYQSQPYQQPLMQGYPATAAGVSEYPIRQGHQGTTPTSFGPTEGSIRSPGTGGYMGQPRYQYSSTQMPYNLAPSSQMPQMGDSTPNRTSQTASMGGLVPGQSFSQSTGQMQSPSQVRQAGSAYPQEHSSEASTGSAGMGMMPQTYHRPQYQTGSTILPPLQSSRQAVSPNGNGNAVRGYYDQSIQGTPPVLPSQPGPSTNGDGYGGEGQAFDVSASGNATPH